MIREKEGAEVAVQLHGVRMIPGPSGFHRGACHQLVGDLLGREWGLVTEKKKKKKKTIPTFSTLGMHSSPVR
jgi:hypothetical protein